jgi:putative Mn2+ efflux pump MntP
MVRLPDPKVFPMNLVSTVLIALAMSTDAFAAAVVKGASLHKPQWREALRTGVIFGVIEAITPLIGWGLGFVAANYIAEWDHWVAFVLLGGLGLRMIYEGLQKPDVEDLDKPNRHSFRSLAITAFATSIDAMAVGVSLAFLDVDIVSTSLVIGAATMLMVTLGVMLGRVVGAIVGKRSEVLGGLVLICIGGAILYEHLHAVPA